MTLALLSSLEAATQARPTRGGGPLIAATELPAAPVTQLLEALPAHHCYVELGECPFPFFVAKPPSSIEVVNDHLGHVANFFAALRTPETLRSFVSYHRRFAVAQPGPGRLAAALTLDTDVAKRAYAWFRLARLLFVEARSAAAKTLLPGSEPSSQLWCRREPLLRRFYTFLERIDKLLPDLHGRLLRVQYESRGDTKRLIELYDAPDTLFLAYEPDRLTVKHLQEARAAVVGYNAERSVTRTDTGVWIKA